VVGEWWRDFERPMRGLVGVVGDSRAEAVALRSGCKGGGRLGERDVERASARARNGFV
jgi:hypothetical protein